jgi:hypothetical protein
MLGRHHWANSGGLKMTKGRLDDLKVVMDLFDKFGPAKNYRILITSYDF